MAVVGANRVGVRISPVNPFNDISDSDPQTLFNYVAKALSPFGLAYLHVLEGGMVGGPFTPIRFSRTTQEFHWALHG